MYKPAILHIITKLDLGGAQKSCLALIAELQKKHPNFEIYLISGHTGELAKQALALKNVYLLDTMIWELHPKNIFLEIKNLRRIIAIMRELKEKHKHLIIHTHTIKAGTIGRWAALIAGIKYRIHTIHGFSFNPYQNKLIWLFFYLIELINSLITTKFICVSTQDLQAGAEILPFFSQKAQIIRAATIYQPSNHTNHLIINKHINIAKNDSNSIIIGTIASLKTGKNLFDLIKAFKLASQTLPKLQLEIVGDGPLRSHIQAYLAQNNLEHKVKIWGWTPNPVQYAYKWDLFVFTSLWEGLPCAIVEMQDLGIPILAYHVGGICDLIAKSNLYHAGRWPALAQAIINFVLHPLTQPAQPPDNSFYIPKMALDHANLYQTLICQYPPFDNENRICKFIDKI
jgi:glycosyltransferase involved in cell wall biosynthesis